MQVARALGLAGSRATILYGFTESRSGYFGALAGAGGWGLLEYLSSMCRDRGGGRAGAAGARRASPVPCPVCRGYVAVSLTSMQQCARRALYAALHLRHRPSSMVYRS